MADDEKVLSIKFNTKQAQAALKRLDKHIVKIEKGTLAAGKTFEKSVGKKAVRAVNKLNRKLKVTTLNLRTMRSGLDKVHRATRIAAAGFAALGGISVRNAIELNEGMANVSTLLSGGIEQVQGLKREVQDLSVETGKGTDDMAEGLYEVVSALGENVRNMGQLRIASRAAVAGRSSTLGAVKLLAAVTKGYGDTSEGAMKKVSDLAFQTVRLGQTTFPELAASMGRVIPLAAAMNTSQEELFATMATATGVTGDTSEVATQVASVYSAMLKPTGALNEAVDKINKSNKDYNFESGAAMMKTLGFRKTLILLNGAVDGNEGKLAKLLKRKEALVIALALLGGQSDVYKQKLDEMGDVVGSTDEAYRRQTEGINKQGHEWEKTKQRMTVFSQRLGNKLLPVLDRLLDKLEPVLKYLENMSEETMDSWIALGKWTIILAVATKGLSSFLGVVQAIGTMRNLSMGITGVGTQLDGVSGKAKKAGAALRAFQASGVLSAAAVGYAIGTMLSEVFFEPHAKKRAKERGGLLEAGVQAGNVARTGTAAEIDAELSKLQAQRAQFKRNAGDASVEELVGGVTSIFSGTTSPAEMRRQAYESANQGIAELSTAKFEKWLGQSQGLYSVTPSQPPPVAPGQTVNVTVPISVTATAGREDEAARKITKAIKREIRNTAPGQQ